MSDTEENTNTNQHNRTRQRDSWTSHQRRVRQRNQDEQDQIEDRRYTRHLWANTEVRELNRLALSSTRRTTRDLQTEHPVPLIERTNQEGFTNLDPNSTSSSLETSNTANLTIRVCLDNYPAFDIFNPATQRFISIAYPDASDTRIPREQRIAIRAIHRSFLDSNELYLPGQASSPHSDSDSSTEE